MTYRLAILYKLKIKGIIINNKCKFLKTYYKLITNNLPHTVEELTQSRVLATIPYIKKPTANKIADILEKYDFIKNL